MMLCCWFGRSGGVWRGKRGAFKRLHKGLQLCVELEPALLLFPGLRALRGGLAIFKRTLQPRQIPYPPRRSTTPDSATHSAALSHTSSSNQPRILSPAACGCTSSSVIAASTWLASASAAPRSLPFISK